MSTSDALIEPRWRDRPSARALLLTVLGEFAVTTADPVPTRRFVDALGLVGVATHSARQALHRSAAVGWLAPSKVGRQTHWHVTPEMRAILDTGADRIYGFGQAPSDGEREWLLLHVPVPEHERSKIRGKLSQRLAWAGFGSPGGALWLSADARREAEAGDVLDRLDLLPHASAIRGRPADMAGLDELVARAWDLGAVAERYREFLADFRAIRPRSPAQSFTHLTHLVHRWRTFPLLDPCLPRTHLPPRWPGERAANRFIELRDRWAVDAQRWWRDQSPTKA